MKVFMTGGTGFLGGHLLKVLLQEENREVAVLARGGRLSLERSMGSWGAAWGLSRTEQERLRGKLSEVQVIEGSLLDGQVLKLGLEGAEQVYHLAGKVSRSTQDSAEMMRVHVEGTRTLLESAAELGAKKVLVVTTSGTVGVSKDANFRATEQSAYPIQRVQKWPYYLSKVYQEQLALDLGQRLELEVLIARPSLLLGPGDIKGSSTGDVRKFLKNRIPGVPPGGISFVDARDVATALPRLMEKGEPGVGYLLTAANWSLSEFFESLARLTGKRRLPLGLPGPVTRWGARALRTLSGTLGWEPELSAMSLEMASCFWGVDSSLARAQLGFQPRSTQETLVDTVQWLQEQESALSREPASLSTGSSQA